ncbi:phospholipid-transporting ATPase ABCA1-like isoform X1 [Athalia rosae]|uniref:phospholipid-transporting ATPase ABCA1-like isoform X1 n=1 Tax=Athalia rosae TaxID=37344 RepID=UPI002034A0D6|nr:phospholipid-transporting ATPase ABCA1-like isoform X1 [Athalia rosae]
MKAQRSICWKSLNVPIFINKNTLQRLTLVVRWIRRRKFSETMKIRMGDGWRILFLLLQKNWIIRKRHWLGTIIEMAAPALLIAIIMGLRTLLPIEATVVNQNTIFPVLNRTYLESNFFPQLLRIFYLPDNEFTKRVMTNATKCLGIPNNQLYGFDDEPAMLENYERLQGQDLTIVALAVAFQGTDGKTVPNNLVYTMKTSRRIESRLITADFRSPSTASDALILEIPFVALQMCLDDSFIYEVVPSSVIDEIPTRVIQKMPFPPYEVNAFSEQFFRRAIGNWAAIMFIVTLFMVPSYITTEKDTGVNALLKMNGVKPYQNFSSWLISGMILGTLTVVFITVMVKIYFSPHQLPFYHYSNSFVFWLVIYLNFIQTYAYCLHLATYFTKARLAQGAAILLLYAVLQIVRQVEKNELYWILPYIGFIFPNAAAMRMFDEFSNHENKLTGAQWNNLFVSEHEVLGFEGTLGFLMISSICSTIFHFTLALYLEAVLPGKYSVQKSPFFFLKCFRKNKVNAGNPNAENTESHGRAKISEPVAHGALTPGIQIKNLKKKFEIGFYKPKIVEAVRGISIEFYKGQITVLLGHNGAGKTTTISILTGLTAPSSGTVLINGKDVEADMQDIRNDLGMCPQENMLFQDLTVEEQLQLFALLKQKKKTRQQVLDDVDDLLAKLKISEKRNFVPKHLSGGQKRRVCLGLALIGNASTLILDEPTSGMDPETARVTWDIILKYRKQKTIIITTHSMEEADVLGDRIAIMHSGQMMCYGSSMFLKKHYGENRQKITLSIESSYDYEKIQSIVGSEARIDTGTYGRLVISIPMTNSLPEILDKMETNKTELGITGVSVSTITLEEVFLRTAQQEEYQEEDEEDAINLTSVNRTVSDKFNDPAVYVKLIGSQLTKQIFIALLIKKFCYARRNWGISMGIIFGTLIAIILMPIFSVSVVTLINSRQLKLTLYDNPEALIYDENGTFADAYTDIVASQKAAVSRVAADENLIDALLERAKPSTFVYYTNNIITSAEFTTLNETAVANGLYNGAASLSVPITVNAISNTFLKTYAGDQYSIDASIENLPDSFIDYLYEQFDVRSENLLQMMLFISVFFIVIGLFVINPLLENTTSVKQLQRMTGVPSVLYWGTMFVFDYGIYIVATIITAIGFFVMDIIFASHTYYATEIGILVLLLLLFGISALLLAYLFSFLHWPLYVVLLIYCLANMIISQIQVFVDLAVVYMGTDNIGFSIQRRIFSLLPHVSFTFGFSKFLEVATNNARCRTLPRGFAAVSCFLNDPCCDMGCVDGVCSKSLPYFGDFSEDAGLEEFVLYLTAIPIILLVILFLLENRAYEKLVLRFKSHKATPSNYGEVAVDSEVANEKLAVRHAINQRELKSRAGEEIPSFADDNIFLGYELSKRYGNNQAVKEVNFRVKKNECFGLLGVNGAGKSTTFRMLVGEEAANTGILIRGYSNIKVNRKEYLAGIGYCPQINALIPSLNSYEHLSLFARLRGIPEFQVASEVQLWIDKLRLNKHAANASGSYSGGNKRRLNIAMALIADPQMVLLDEPTTGVDPGARRSLWRVLQSCQASGQAIILTSHSMEECEALCNRLLIMVQGRLVCVGASQELKQRFGAGYDITVKLNPERSEEENSKIKKKIQAAIACELRDEHPGYLFYHVTDPQTTWTKMFRTINDVKAVHSCIEDYTVSSSTLEQLFIQFARSAPGSILPTTRTNGITNGTNSV